MRSLLTIIVILCSLAEEKLLSQELKLKDMLKLEFVILVTDATDGNEGFVLAIMKKCKSAS